MFVVCIMDHFVSIHNSLDVDHQFLGIFIRFCYDIFPFKSHMGIDFMYYHILHPLKESSGFCFGCALLHFRASGCALCMGLKSFCSKGWKDITEVIFTVCLKLV